MYGFAYESPNFHDLGIEALLLTNITTKNIHGGESRIVFCSTFKAQPCLPTYAICCTLAARQQSVPQNTVSLLPFGGLPDVAQESIEEEHFCSSTPFLPRVGLLVTFSQTHYDLLQRLEILFLKS